MKKYCCDFGALAAAFICWAPARPSPRRGAGRRRRPGRPRDLLPSGLIVELGPESARVATFRIRGDELEGAVLEGEASREGDAWTLDVEGMEWFGTWSEGWTEASFVDGGRARPEGRGEDADARDPRGAEDRGAEVGLYQALRRLFEGDKALPAFSPALGPDPGRGRSAQGALPRCMVRLLRVPNTYVGPLRRTPTFQKTARAFLFPELYGYPKG